MFHCSFHVSVVVYTQGRTEGARDSTMPLAPNHWGRRKPQQRRKCFFQLSTFAPERL